jgi:hypothetical protein
MSELETMQQPSSALGGLPSPHRSPVLMELPDSRLPQLLPVCATCPASNWFTTVTDLRCYCNAFRLLSWNDKEEAVMSCDAREAAILQMMSDKAEE